MADPVKEERGKMGWFRRFASVVIIFFFLNPPGLTLGAGKPTGKAAAVEEQPEEGGVFHLPLLNEPPTLDPALTEDTYALPVLQQIFDGLVQFSPELFVVPGLAQNWRIEDKGKLFRFFLRPNVRFHNGRSVTAEDVVFSLSRLMRVNPPPSILPNLLKIHGAEDYREHKSDRVAGIQVEDDHSLLVRLDEPYTPFLAALGMYQAKIVPREEVSRQGGAFGRNPIGSGPFQFTSWEGNQRIRLRKYAGYHGGTPYLEEIQFLIYPGGRIDDVLSDFRQGKLEGMPVYWQFREKLMENRQLRWVHRPSLSLLFYGMNCQHPALKNPELRRALAAATDRQKIVAEVYQGQFEQATTVLPPGMPGYQPQNRKWGHDLELATKLVKKTLETGEKPAPTIEVVSNSQSPLAQAELNLVREAWARLGIKMEPKFIPDWSQFEEYLRSDALQIYRYSWVADMPDPDSVLRPLFSSSSRVNFMRYRNEDMDLLLTKMSQTVDPLERARLCQRMEEVAAASAPLIPLFYLSVDRVYQANVRGIEVSALGEEAVSFHHVWLKALSKP